MSDDSNHTSAEQSAPSIRRLTTFSKAIMRRASDCSKSLIRCSHLRYQPQQTDQRERAPGRSEPFEERREQRLQRMRIKRGTRRRRRRGSMAVSARFLLWRMHALHNIDREADVQCHIACAGSHWHRDWSCRVCAMTRTTLALAIHASSSWRWSSIRAPRTSATLTLTPTRMGLTQTLTEMPRAVAIVADAMAATDCAPPPLPRPDESRPD